MSDRPTPGHDEQVWEVERDRFGVQFSGPLEVGECRRVVEASALEEVALERDDSDEENIDLRNRVKAAEGDLAAWRARSQGLENAQLTLDEAEALHTLLARFMRSSNRQGYPYASALEKLASLSLGLPDEEGDWRKTAMGDAKDALACGDGAAAWHALNRHEPNHSCSKCDGAAPPPRGAAREGADATPRDGFRIP